MAAKSEMDRFNSDVSASPSLRSELEAIGTDLETVVSFANARGYAFTTDDVRASAGELSDEALEGITGGAEPALASSMTGKWVFLSKSGLRFTIQP